MCTLVKPFDFDEFTQACLDALGESDPAEAIRELMQRAVSDPRALELACPMPLDASDDGLIHLADELMIAHGIFPRDFHTGIHDHGVQAIIGVWTGYEDNHLFERTDQGLKALGARRVATGEVLVLGPDAVHDVYTPTNTYSAALHVYLGNIIAAPRHSWTSAESAASAFDGAALEQQWMEAALATGLAVDRASSV